MTAFKHLLILALTLTTVFCSMGSYQPVQGQELQELKQESHFIEVQSKALENYSEQNQNSELGTLIGVKKQIVAGINFKLIYQNDSGDVTEITVFCQPWTNTIQVLEIQLNAQVDSEILDFQLLN